MFFLLAAATKGLGEQKASDLTEVTSRKSMLDAIEREFEVIQLKKKFKDLCEVLPLEEKKLN